ncbi:MAG: class E sortase [Bifidobacteriaceae bacterium]|jgi:sortase A|nr:class E sortase [Bifidobacteriaceae bacterium]
MTTSPNDLELNAGLRPRWRPVGQRPPADPAVTAAAPAAANPPGPPDWPALAGKDRQPAAATVGDPVGSRASRRRRAERRKKRRGAAVVGVIGELMITVGVVLGLYVVWELVWTDVEANAEAREIRQEIVADKTWVTPPAGSEFARLRDPAQEAPPVDQAPMAVPGFGQAWGTLHVPRWGQEYNTPIVEGTDRVKILNKGLIGRYEGTQGPAEIGNFATSAHRTTYGKPYNRVAELEDGDSLIVETGQHYFVYKVYGREIVYPDAIRVIWPVPNEQDATPTKRIMTLTTCHPMFSAAQRYIIWGELAYWADKADGPLEELAAQG